MGNKRPESPLMKLARVLGGAVLTQGRLGHQVLGQLLISNLTQSEVAGAVLVSAAGSRRGNVFAQAAIGTAAPALAVQALVDKADRRLTRREQALLKREEQLLQRSNTGTGEAKPEEPSPSKPEPEAHSLRPTGNGSSAAITELEQEKQALVAQVEVLGRRLEVANQSAHGAAQQLLLEKSRIEALERSYDAATAELVLLRHEKRALEVRLEIPRNSPEVAPRSKRRGRGGKGS